MNDAMVNTIVPESGFRTPAEMGDAKAPTGHLLTTTVPVQFLKEYEKMAPGPARGSQGTLFSCMRVKVSFTPHLLVLTKCNYGSGESLESLSQSSLPMTGTTTRWALPRNDAEVDTTVASGHSQK